MAENGTPHHPKHTDTQGAVMTSPEILRIKINPARCVTLIRITTPLTAADT